MESLQVGPTPLNLPGQTLPACMHAMQRCHTVSRHAALHGSHILEDRALDAPAADAPIPRGHRAHCRLSHSARKPCVNCFAMCASGPQLDLPHDVTPAQLETLLNGLLASEERLPYSFFIDDSELGEELGAFLLRNNVSVETALHIVYQPQAVFRVRPVSRCTASMPGELRR